MVGHLAPSPLMLRPYILMRRGVTNSSLQNVDHRGPSHHLMPWKEEEEEVLWNGRLLCCYTPRDLRK